MTFNPCPAGSRPKPGFEKDLVWQGTSLNDLVQAAAPWLAAYANLMAPFILNGASFCASPRPSLPVWGIEDVNAVVLGGVSAVLRQTLNAFAWDYMCECNDGTSPAPEFLPQPAEGLPRLAPEPLQPCHVEIGSYLDASIIGDYIIPNTHTVPFAGIPIIPTATALRLSVQLDTLGDANEPVQRDFEWFISGTGPGAGLHHLLVTPPSRSGQLVVPVDMQDGQYTVGIHYGGLNGPVPFGADTTATVEQFCGGVPGQLQPECCPPDPGIVNILRDLQLQIALLVARAGPTEDLEELSALPITGEGTVALALGARAVLIELNTLGSTTQTVPYANPDRVMRAGTVRFGNDFGWRRREHVDSTRCLFPIPSDASVASWSLSPGTVGRLVQLGEPR